jgi:hypothetical protein
VPLQPGGAKSEVSVFGHGVNDFVGTGGACGHKRCCPDTPSGVSVVRIALAVGPAREKNRSVEADVVASPRMSMAKGPKVGWQPERFVQ